MLAKSPLDLLNSLNNKLKQISMGLTYIELVNNYLRALL